MLEKKVYVSALRGKRILVTRTREQASAFSERLRALGAIPVEFPTIRIAPPQDWGPLDEALRKLYAGPYFDWLVFTSANGVERVFERLQALGLDGRAVGNARVAAIGPATAAALARCGIQADLVPQEYIAEGVAGALIEDARRRGVALTGKRILLARAAEARQVLVSELQEAGALVCEVAAYRTLPVESDDEQGREVARMLRAGELHMITFTSSSTVRNFMQWLEQSVPDIAGELRGQTTAHSTLPVIACIGPVTARSARQAGLDVSIEAATFTIDGLIEALADAS
jgi:uroporphyrinogen-III synthase